jgi:molybdopterin molybdotransferase
MDGYVVGAEEIGALESAGVPTSLRVSGSSLPGAPWIGPIPAGTAVRVMTGALLPPNADRVVPVEETDGEASPGVVLLGGAGNGKGGLSAPGRHVRPAGEESRAGEVLARPGDTVEAGPLALLAAAGIEDLRVHLAPRVALVVTGSELVPAGRLEALEGGVRRADVLAPTLPHWIRWAGGLPLAPRTVPDDPGTIRDALAQARDEADLVLTTGGASMGSADLVKDVLDEMDIDLDFWRIRMRPGSPVSLGRLKRGRGDRVPVLGLPGNPVSAAVAFLVLGVPAIRSLGGHRRESLASLSATARGELGGPDDLTRFVRVALVPEGGGRWGAAPAGPQGSGAIRSLALADGLAYLPEGSPPPPVGEPVEVLLLPRSGWAAGS